MVWIYLHSNFRGEAEGIMALQGHPMSLILEPIESAYATSYWLSIVTLVASCHILEILHVFCWEERPTPIPIPPEFHHWATSSSLIVWVFVHSNFRGELRKTHLFWNRGHNGPSRLSKVVDFGINRKRECDFLLVINSNLGRILPHYRDIARFLLRRATHPYSTRILGVFLLD